MEYSKFKTLLNKGECKTIDYKIECSAFNRGNEKSTAELAKDIITFANNGNIASYLIIGVADDRNGFKSVDNNNLTDDKLQILCKDFIFPIPKVKLINCLWNNVTDERHKNIKFVVIQVGPQARQCFRFNKDCINYEKKYCFKKNEVWLRREATSDLALPEEIKRLLEGKEPISKQAVENNIMYNRISKFDYKDVMRNDLTGFIRNINGIFNEKTIRIFKSPDLYGNIITLNVNGMNLKIMVVINDTFKTQGIISKVFQRKVAWYHGILFLARGNITKSALGVKQLEIKERWGTFIIKPRTAIKSKLISLPTTDKDLSWELYEPFCLILDKIDCTQSLENRLQSIVNTIVEEDDIKSYIKNVYNRINSCLLKWRESNCVLQTDKVLFEESDRAKYTSSKIVMNLSENEFIDKVKYGNLVMMKDLDKCKVIDEFLSSELDSNTIENK